MAIVNYTPGIRSIMKGFSSVCLSVRPSVRLDVILSFTSKFFDYFYLHPLIKNFSYLVWGYLGGSSSILHQ